MLINTKMLLSFARMIHQERYSLVDYRAIARRQMSEIILKNMVHYQMCIYPNLIGNLVLLHLHRAKQPAMYFLVCI
jgi:hypothetical protein